MNPFPRKPEDPSALSGHSMRALSRGDRVWQSSAATQKTKPARAPKKHQVKAAPLPKFVEPMKARLAAHPPKGDWLYEIKFDGYRALALKGGSQVRLLSRTEKDF